MSGGWLCWENERLLLIGADGRVLSGFPDERVSIDEIGRIGFAVERSWQLTWPGERCPNLLVSTSGESWEVLPDAPLHGPAHEAAVGLFPYADRVSVVEKEMFHFFLKGRGWNTIPLPPGGDWVAPGIQGEWWAVGSRPAARVRTADREVALWRCRETEGEWETLSIRTSWRDAYRTIRDGGFEHLRTVDPRPSPLILASECAWFLEDPSWFLFTLKPSGRFAIQRLPDSPLARIERDGEGRPTVITTDGEMWDWDGRKWNPRGTAASLREALGYTPDFQGHRVHLALSHPEIFGVVARLGRGMQLDRVTVWSGDGGESWRVSTPDGIPGPQPVAAWAQPAVESQRNTESAAEGRSAQ